MPNISVAGENYAILDTFVGGGQGDAQLVVPTNANHQSAQSQFVIKSMKANVKTTERTQKLVEFNLAKKSPFLASPFAFEKKSRKVLHVAPFADGKDIGDDRPRTFPERIEVAHHFATNLCILEEMGLAHGDLAPNNLIITSEGAVYLIDFDNYASTDPNIPKPSMMGQAIMVAPELRANKAKANIYSDRFSMGVLMNMLILGRHPADFLTDLDQMKTALSSGQWQERNRPVQSDCTPIEALGKTMPLLFDRANSLNPQLRPSADEWRRNLQKAVTSMYAHNCGQAFIYDGQLTCPWCKQQIIAPTIRVKINVHSIGQNYVIELAPNQSVIVGRQNLGLSNPSVSRRHIEISYDGNKVQLVNFGQNGMFAVDGTLASSLYVREKAVSFRCANELITIYLNE